MSNINTNKVTSIEMNYANPFLTALPEMSDLDQIDLMLLREPTGDFSSKNMTIEEKFMQISSLLNTNLPRNEASLMAMRCQSMVVNAYSNMNPLKTETNRKMYAINDDSFSANARRPVQSDAMTILGRSGMGKTTLIKSVLDRYPQVIRHKNFQGQKFERAQVIYLSVDAPVNGSPKGLIMNIASALDDALNLEGEASYVARFEGGRESVEVQRVRLTRALAANAVGLLHIDDLQRLAAGPAKTVGSVAAMIIGISNSAGCSLVFSGTEEALPVLHSSFELARRASRRGSITLELPKSSKDDFFSALVDWLYKHQLCEVKEFPGEEIKEHLFKLTKGIPGVLVPLYVNTQEVAIRTKMRMTKELYSGVMMEQSKNFQSLLWNMSDKDRIG